MRSQAVGSVIDMSYIFVCVSLSKEFIKPRGGFVARRKERSWIEKLGEGGEGALKAHES